MSSVEWSPVVSSQESHDKPVTRHKHAMCLDQSHLYLLGGKQGNIPLKDFWRYDIVSEKWAHVIHSGCSLPALQQHTMIVTGQKIYVFGGELAMSNDTPLWIYDIPEAKWNKWSSNTPDPGGGNEERNEVFVKRKMRKKKRIHKSFGELSDSPSGRRGHTALLIESTHSLEGAEQFSTPSQIIIFGGHKDLHGSTDELWTFHIKNEKWKHLESYGEAPAARHGHSAVLHDGQMWVYGGMTDLCERNDLWKYHIGVGSWQCVQSRPNPGTRHSHSATVLKSSMLVFAGQSEGKPMNDLWRYHFGTSTWQQLVCPGVTPQPRSQFSAFVSSSHHSNASSICTGFGSENGVGNHLNLRKLSGANRSNYSRGSSGYGSASSSAYSKNGYGSRIRSQNSRKISPEESATGSGNIRIHSARSSLCSNDSDEDVDEDNIDPDQQKSLIKNKTLGGISSHLMLSISKLPQINISNYSKYDDYSKQLRSFQDVPGEYSHSEYLLNNESKEVIREEVIDYCMERNKTDFAMMNRDINKNNSVSENVESVDELIEDSSTSDIDNQIMFKEDINLLGEPSGFSITRKAINYNYLKGSKTNNYKSFHNPNYVYYNSEKELVEILPAVQEKDSLYQDRVDDLDEIKHKEFAQMLGASPNSKKFTLELQKCVASSSHPQPRPSNTTALSHLELEVNNDHVHDKDYLYKESINNTESESPLRVKKAWEGSFNENSNDESRMKNMAMFIIGGKECNDYTIFKRPISMWKLEVSFE